MTRAPIDGGCRPSSASSTPAFCSDSLYFIIAATASALGHRAGLRRLVSLGDHQHHESHGHSPGLVEGASIPASGDGSMPALIYTTIGNREIDIGPKKNFDPGRTATAGISAPVRDA